MVTPFQQALESAHWVTTFSRGQRKTVPSLTRLFCANRSALLNVGSMSDIGRLTILHREKLLAGKYRQ